MILLGKRLKIFVNFPRLQSQLADLWFAKLSGAHPAQRSDPQIPHARDTVWAGIGNLVDLHQGERKLVMVDFNRFKPPAQTVPKQPAMKVRWV